MSMSILTRILIALFVATLATRLMFIIECFYQNAYKSLKNSNFTEDVSPTLEDRVAKRLKKTQDMIWDLESRTVIKPATEEDLEKATKEQEELRDLFAGVVTVECRLNLGTSLRMEILPVLTKLDTTIDTWRNYLGREKAISEWIGKDLNEEIEKAEETTESTNVEIGHWEVTEDKVE